MEANKGYHMPLTDVAEFAVHSRIQGYTFKEITLGGGEPLLWRWLLPAAAILKDSGIAEGICVITNGLLIGPSSHERIAKLSEVVSRIRISRYIGNEDNIKYGTVNFPKVEVSPQIHRPVTPDQPVPDSLPADCVCRGRGYAHGEISVCTPARSMGHLTPDLATRPKGAFLSFFDNIERTNQWYCQVCVGNRNIYDRIEFIENEVICG
jgi:hypothetical protein